MRKLLIVLALLASASAAAQADRAAAMSAKLERQMDEMGALCSKRIEP